jgi:DNA-binding NarL/FixJ family response regulator
MIRVLLADDQRLVRAGLRMLCDSTDDLEVVGEAADGHEAVRLAEQTVPDVVLMDLRMPRMDGITAARRLIERLPSARVVALTTFDDDDHLYPALLAGMCGFLVKDMSPEQLVDAIRKAYAGEAPFSPPVLRRLVERATSHDPAANAADPATAALQVELTTRERDVLTLLTGGLSNGEIAARLHVGVTTVKTHVASMMAKTGYVNRVQLAVYGARIGLAPGGTADAAEAP